VGEGDIPAALDISPAGQGESNVHGGIAAQNSRCVYNEGARLVDAVAIPRNAAISKRFEGKAVVSR